MATLQAPAEPALKHMPEAIEPKKTRPVVWWAVIGAGFLLFAAYLIAAWLIHGDIHRVPSGPTPLPEWMKIALSAQQWGLAAIALCLIYFKAIRPRMQTGRMSFDGLLILSFGLMWWSDPFYSYFQQGFSYNAYFVNLGSWISEAPGWMAPHGDRIPQPLIWLPGVYICAFFAMTLIATAIMRKSRELYPQISAPTVWLIAFVPMVVAGTAWEAAFMALGSHHYGSGIEGLTLNHGEYYQFPVYQGITASLLYTSWAALRFFRDDQGRSVVERGIDRVRAGAVVKGWLRFFAISGAVTTIFFVAYHLPNSIFSLEGSAWPPSIQERSYFSGSLCGPGTDIACPAPDVPVPRGDGSLHVSPDGKLVVPPGATPPHPVPQKTTD